MKLSATASGVLVLALLASVPAITAEPAAGLTDVVRSAEAGSASAQFDLGTRYLNGVGVDQDNFEALRWFTLAAEQNNSNAQYNIAVMYLNGIGVIKDQEQAVEWFLKAADNGDVSSQFTLGIILFNGQLNVPQNTAEAYKWFTLAGAGGHQTAAANAVLLQELLPPDQVIAMQDAAKVWIEAFNARQAGVRAEAAAETAP
ncbi:MAG: tetratricopeptide repeat protein [Pseudohongiella sp.]|nr:tetratricopeptide repeat protein [Pseudohongiella sp.]MDO9518593.1 tetratricopeptide repeat protein [Pseudohongiella sp.]MDP2127209.1 tetratricopeptide repeat protein [Pseudohongiella sp.]